MREIGRELAAEIERVFEAKVNPGTLKERARRMEAGTNVPTDENQATAPLHPGDNGDKITPDTVIPMVEKVVKRGMSIREVVAYPPAVIRYRPSTILSFPLANS